MEGAEFSVVQTGRRAPRLLSAWLPGLALTGCCSLAWALQRKTSEKLVKVMSFNLRYENRDDDRRGFGWERRLPLVAEVVMRHDPDILGTQEAGSWLKIILHCYDYLNPIRNRYHQLLKAPQQWRRKGYSSR